ncbi:MAG: hypothetical protein HQK58_14760 [Deltaproteobacteria bacterium]|nr:hypothetical protein [Deltaproteobacteria bacterium]MBF0524138.1 hypothetical protein [Deltaproteobacteria bacterium]
MGTERQGGIPPNAPAPDVNRRNMTTGVVGLWFMNVPVVSSMANVSANVDLNWKTQLFIGP